MEMMQDNNTVSLLVDAIKTHMKVVCFLSINHKSSFLPKTCYAWVFLGRESYKECVHGACQYCRGRW